MLGLCLLGCLPPVYSRQVSTFSAKTTDSTIRSTLQPARGIRIWPALQPRGLVIRASSKKKNNQTEEHSLPSDDPKGPDNVLSVLSIREEIFLAFSGVYHKVSNFIRRPVWLLFLGHHALTQHFSIGRTNVPNTQPKSSSSRLRKDLLIAPRVAVAFSVPWDSEAMV
nr:unnamed protein product [Spirometra erinaceieuropaei]